ncbi:hypothetical protein [Paenibacillus xylaniclasticus]|uniref:hypothetical protein n=1 Tax=Paenibacillus xylaniclasticus TaxID=588083 RepID=UPI000FDA64B8|nr:MULTISPECIES: hypothetical protein [Paenibacillus]GFN32479.1 hypothetical protein PCURB6_27390 [Paenibacillus curdlanolyticus]
MIEKKWDSEGCILTISSDSREDQLKVYWNGDTPEYSMEISRGEEIFMYVTSSLLKKRDASSISLSTTEAEALRDTLNHMINEIKRRS